MLAGPSSDGTILSGNDKEKILRQIGLRLSKNVCTLRRRKRRNISPLRISFAEIRSE